MRVFLSRNVPSKALVDHARKSDWDLICFSCIEFSLISESGPPLSDWIFFYGPSAVKLFAKNFKTRSFRFAVLGEGTADAMRESGIQPEFIGKSSDTSEVMVEFEAVLKSDERVVQARGEKSFERLREQLPSSQILDWPFYRTQAKPELPEAIADYYIFTSPSNAEAYLKRYDLPLQTVVVVLGESTRAMVREKSDARTLVTDIPGEESSIQKIKEDQIQL